MPGDMMHFKQIGQLPTLIESLAPRHSPIDLLKGDQVGFPLLDDAADSL